MHYIFEHYLKEQTGLPDDLVQQVSGMATAHSLRRNEAILQPGDVCRHKVFICSGMLRTYSTGAGGNEHILQFAPELTWTLDVESYDKGTPTVVTIDAIEPTGIIMWQKNDFEMLRNDIPVLKKFSEELISRNIYYSRQRMLTALSATPEEKYEDFVQRFPGLLQRLPLRMIASYLGISIKTLTRIRHAQLQR